MIAGVSGGLARYLGVDTAVVRVAFVVLALFGGSGLVAYIIGWVAIPNEKPGEELGFAERSGLTSGSVLIGLLLVGVGTLWLLDQVVPGFRQVFGPLLLIAVGVFVLLRIRR
jgi:phage shock protein C